MIDICVSTSQTISEYFIPVYEASVVAAFLYGLKSSDPKPGIHIFQFLSAI